MKKRTKKIMALMMTAAVAATTFVTGGSTVYAEKAEDYSEPLPEDYEAVSYTHLTLPTNSRV